MTASLLLFAVLFAVIWLMHRPFDVHHARHWLNRLHEWLELALAVQGVIILNMLLWKL
ncbi:MAG: hypothetical protein IKP00_16600 [Victivallales bacterium]|nr:hypothetical protein [Victivallales bacterium]